MMQVSDDMVEAARSSLVENSGRTYSPSNMQMRAALEAALAVRKPLTSDEVSATAKRTRLEYDTKVADLIERQATEIARLKDKVANRDH